MTQERAMVDRWTGWDDPKLGQWLRECTHTASQGKPDGTGGYKSWVCGSQLADDTYYPRLWSYLAGWCKPERVLDVGCAEGRAVSYWNRFAAAKGIDAAPEAIAASPVREHLEVWDLRWGPYRDYREGKLLVWSAETVEHIGAEYLQRLMATLTQMGEAAVVAITHAVPGQGGYHHVNCRPETYWVHQFAAWGYVKHVELTAESRKLGHKYYRDTGLVFVPAQE